MRWKQCGLVGVAAGALALATGCASGPRLLAPNTQQTVVLERAAKRTVVESALAEELTLRLPPVTLAGYRWRLFFHDPRVLHQTSPIREPAEPAGAPSISFVTQRAPARTRLRFMLVQNMREDEPADSHEVVVNVRTAPAPATGPEPAAENTP